MSLNQVSGSIEDGSVPVQIKLRYQSPVLSCYGNVAALTRGGAVSGVENASGMAGSSCAAGGNPNFPHMTCL